MLCETTRQAVSSLELTKWADRHQRSSPIVGVVDRAVGWSSECDLAPQDRLAPADGLGAQAVDPDVA